MADASHPRLESASDTDQFTEDGQLPSKTIAIYDVVYGGTERGFMLLKDYKLDRITIKRIEKRDYGSPCPQLKQKKGYRAYVNWDVGLPWLRRKQKYSYRAYLDWEGFNAVFTCKASAKETKFSDFRVHGMNRKMEIFTTRDNPSILYFKKGVEDDDGNPLLHFSVGPDRNGTVISGLARLRGDRKVVLKREKREKMERK